MYATYECDQECIVTSNGTLASSPWLKDNQRPVYCAYKDSKEPDFKPTWLVRVSDMKVVRGTDVHEAYYTLSYSWNQSGDIIQNEEDGTLEPKRVDRGKHKIISYRSFDTRRHLIGRKEKRIQTATRLVKYEELIQQICKDFGIRYIWYDQMCINQSDHEEKKREIRQMHNIYKYAYCTLALVPELQKEWCELYQWSRCYLAEQLPVTEWSKRVWTLEETYMSSKILLVGRNVFLQTDLVHIDSQKIDGTLYNICQRSIKWSASTALFQARGRTSTRQHDRYFSLANMFPEISYGITFDYHQPVIDLAIQFYGLLATHDLSLLLFGTPHPKFESSRPVITHPWDDSLPSWTGTSGVHIPQTWSKGEPLYRTPFSNYTVNGTSLIAKCSFIRVYVKDQRSIILSDDQSGEDQRDNNTRTPLLRRTSSVTLDESFIPSDNCCENLIFVRVAATTDTPNEGFLRAYNVDIDRYGIKSTHILPVLKRKREAVEKDTDGETDKVSFWMNSLVSPTEIGGWLSLTEECSECVILSGIAYSLNNYERLVSMPVVVNRGDHYRSIGVCIIEQQIKFPYPGVEQPEQEFIIE